MNLNFKTAMIFDAICACNLISFPGKHNKATQYEFLKIMKERTGEIFNEGALSYSTMCNIVARYIANPSCADLDDLYSMFQSISEVDTVIRSKVKNEFQQSYIFPALEVLKNGSAEKYCEYITALKAAGFEELWREKVLPVEQEQINRLQSNYESANIDSITKTISELKVAVCESVTTYVSLLSFPVSFTLDETTFLDTINDNETYYKNGFLSMIAHELMHGFASLELTDIYVEFMDRSRYLRSTHKSLIEDMHSGDEEEFVMAAEYYILWRSNIMSKAQIVLENYNRYNGCVPMSLYIFDYMTKERNPIENYDRWLINGFKNGVFNEENIFSTIDSLLPAPTDYDSFFTVLFTILKRCAYILRDAQLTASEDIKIQIEQLTDARFVLNGDRHVSFANETKEIGSDAKRETLTDNLLTVDRIEFKDKKEALDFRFAYRGANVGAWALEYNGERFESPFILNMAYHKDKSNRAEFSFVCANTRYLVTAACPDYVIDIDTEEDQSATYRAYGKEMIDAVKKAESIVMLLK